jgi:hypothetical protein
MIPKIEKAKYLIGAKPVPVQFFHQKQNMNRPGYEIGILCSKARP